MAQRGARVPTPAVALVGRQVGLDDDAVDPERQRGAQRGDFLDPRLDLLDGGDRARGDLGVPRRVHAEVRDAPEDLAVRQLGQLGGQFTGVGQR